MGWLVDSCYNLKSKGYEFDPLLHKEKQIKGLKKFYKIIVIIIMCLFYV